MSNDDAIIREAVRQAQRLAAERGLAIGDTVAHPDEPVTMELIALAGDEAVIAWEGRELRVPLSELFDPNDAMRLSRMLATAGGFS